MTQLVQTDAQFVAQLAIGLLVQMNAGNGQANISDYQIRNAYRAAKKIYELAQNDYPRSIAVAQKAATRQSNPLNKP